MNAENGCIKGLATNRDDSVAQEKFNELSAIINSSVIGKGTLPEPGDDSVYLNIRYNNAEARTFNLRNASASVNEETLSLGAEIINFFEQVGVEIDQNGTVSCNNGKK